MSEQGYSCCGGRDCGAADGLDRRDFLKAASAGGIAMFAVPAPAAQDAGDHEAWKRSLFEQGSRRVYRGDELTHIAMPLGGIGAGQVYLRGDGTLNPWQVVNNFNHLATVTGSVFGISALGAGGRVSRLLQLGSLGEAMGVQAIEFSGEYPFAWVRYLDEALPVDTSLEAYSPYVPLNSKDSALPAVVFRFVLRNRSGAPAEASILAGVPNLVGWDGYRPFDGLDQDECGDNYNVFERGEGLCMLHLRATESDGHAFAAEARLFTNDEHVAQHFRHCKHLKVHWGRPIPVPDDHKDSDLYWVADLGGRLSPGEVERMLDVIARGGAVVMTTDAHALAYALNRKKRDDIEIFEDWSTGTYANWTITGDCFGAAPVTGTLPGQQSVDGWKGKYFVNTYVGGDGATGKATSRSFVIAKSYIRLLVGGGYHPGETCVDLVVDGKVVKSATGDNTERLRPVIWDVRDLRGQSAHIEIVDRHTGGWGHVLVSEIVFADSPRTEYLSEAAAKRFADAAPFTCRSARPSEKAQPIRDEGGVLRGVRVSNAAQTKDFSRFNGKRKKRDATVWMQTRDKAPLAVARKFGKGTFVLCNGAPDRWFAGANTKTVCGNLLAHASGNSYTPAPGVPPDSPLTGSMALAVLGEGEAAARPQAGDFGAVWAQFAQAGRLEGDGTASTPSEPGHTWSGYLAVRVSLAPGEEKSIPFVLAWHFPNRTRDGNYGWGPPRFQYDHRLGNQYNNWFGNAGEVVRYVAANHDRLAAETALFHTTFYNSTLPRYYLDAVTANASITRSPIYVWLEDGTVGGFEGADRCCPMNCTHVYNYAMSTAYLFPDLERNVRETDLLVQMHPEEHYIPHRTVLPLSLPRLGKNIGGPEHPALDGELGTILKTYREWKMCGDRAWLEKLWGRVRTLMRYIMKEHDPRGTGVIQGEQPNTYDTHLYGSNTFIGTLYLAALRAAEELAKVMGDREAAREFRDRFEKGREGYDRVCWNGEYYYNVYDAPGADAATYNNNNCFGPGCHADQLLGQWWAHVLGLGYVLPRERVRTALESIHKYCWRADLSDHVHKQRVFAEGKEKGLLCCAWPKGGRPERPILYCDEVWTGLEYHVAATMIYEGMLEEALQIVRGARDRYTGNQRNPWSEIECGEHYARAMSSFSLVHAAAGLDYDAGAARLAFSPRIGPDNYKGFFISASGWGSLAQQRERGRQRNDVELKYGELALRTVEIDLPANTPRVREAAVTIDRKPVRVKVSTGRGRCRVAFSNLIRLAADDPLRIELRLA